MKSVPLPDYAADELLRRRKHSTEFTNDVELRLKRTYRLIADALADFENKQWRINDAPEYRLTVLDEFYGLEKFDYGLCVYASERGMLSMLAVFDSAGLAADYFVWIVSKGRRTIDWTKFTEEHP
jgi:hypothetical protein